MNICMVVGVDDAVRVVADVMKPFAAPGKLPPYNNEFGNLRRIGDIEAFFDMRDGHEGEAMFRFVTHDNIEIVMNIDFKSLTREYLDGMAKELEDKIGQKRRQRGAAHLFHPMPNSAQ